MPEKINQTLNNHTETKKLAQVIASALSPGDAVLLKGSLGAGKTELARQIIRVLCENPNLDVPSPTYAMVQLYNSQICDIWHFDLYRMGRAEDIIELGWETAQAGAISIIEWPERLGVYHPFSFIEIEMMHHPEEKNRRSANITYGGYFDGQSFNQIAKQLKESEKVEK